MPHAQAEDARGLDLVAHLVLADENTADLSRFVLLELLSDARLGGKPGRCRRQGLQDGAAARRFTAEVVEPVDILSGLKAGDSG